MDEVVDGPGPFANMLRALREGAALTQQELAERAGLTSKAIGALERGERRRPYPHTVRALAAALELDEDRRAALTAAARPGTDGRQPARPVPTVEAIRGRPLVEPSTPLLGRESELESVLSRLRAGRTRLLTLTGPGGVGKTRLALAAAARLRPEIPDGVAVAELAPIRDPALALATAAAALGLPQVGPGDVVGQLATYLGERGPLLLLDNVEHVLGMAASLAELLARCPNLMVLATSRAPLRIRAEQELPVPPLALPTSSSATAVLASPAGQMFLERARAAAPPYPITPELAPTIAEICRRLDGLPLALELAAAHARLLDPATLLARLDQAVGAGRSRELPERQRTMHAALDWSHALLTREEQTLLRRLSVFAGGFTLPAADRVAGPELDIFTALTGLAEQSLVVAPDMAGRYRLLEPIRQYAASRLAAAGDAGAVAAAHAAHFGELAAQARDGLRSAAQGQWLDRLERDHANLQIAVATLAAGAEPGRAAQLFSDTWLYWALRGHAGEALDWLHRLVGSSEATLTAEQRAGGQTALAGLSYATGDLVGTARAGLAAVEAARSTDRAAQLAEALLLAGSAAAFAGELVSATALLSEANSLSDQIGDSFIRAHVALTTGQIELLGGQEEPSRRTLAEAERQARQLASPFTLATVLNMQASLALVTGRDAEALACLAEAASLASDAGIPWTVVYTLPNLAGLAVEAELPEVAVGLFAGAGALAEGTGIVISFPPDVARRDRLLTAVREQLDPATFGRQWAAGRSLALDEIPHLARLISTSLDAR